MPSLSAVTGNPSSPGPSAPLGSGTDTGAADSASQAGNAEEGVPTVLFYGSLHASRPLMMIRYAAHLRACG